MSRISQRSTNTATPIAKTVSTPFTLDPHVQAMNTPVAISQPHHSIENSLSFLSARAVTINYGVLPVTKFSESNVGIGSERHEEDQDGIKQYQPGLRDMRVVCKTSRELNLVKMRTVVLTKQEEDRRERRNHRRITTLLHDAVYDRNRQAAQYGWQRPHSDIRDMIFRVAVSDTIERKTPVKAHKPTSQAEQHLCERRVDVEVIFPLDVIRCKFPKMNLIESIESGQ